MPEQATGMADFGDLLRYWRGVRRVSQLDLAGEAEISARHLSFLESGRSSPSRAMVRRLAGVLGLPAREENDLLNAAGYASIHGESDLGEPAMDRYRRVIDWILDKQEPYPALVMDRYWNILAANRAARALIATFLAPDAMQRQSNAMELLFAKDGLQPLVENWEEVASAMLSRVYREHAASPRDRTLAELYERLASREAAPRDWRRIAAGLDPGPVLPLLLRRGDLRASLFTTITTFGTAQDVTLQELRIEQYFPTDEATRRLLINLSENGGPQARAPGGRKEP